MAAAVRGTPVGVVVDGKNGEDAGAFGLRFWAHGV